MEQPINKPFTFNSQNTITTQPTSSLFNSTFTNSPTKTFNSMFNSPYKGFSTGSFGSSSTTNKINTVGF